MLATDSLVRLDEVPALPQETVVEWHSRHLNPALIKLMKLGGYEGVRVVRAEGPWLHTDDGRQLLDLVSSYGGLNHGHNHPRLLQAQQWFNEQAPADLLKEFPSPYPAALAHNLASLTPGDLDIVFFCNSGTESVEGALKLSMRYFAGKRNRFVYAENSLHGKTLGTLQITGREKYRRHIRRFDDWPMVPYGDLEALARVFAEDVDRTIAGLVLEPIQGEAGVVVPPAGYLKGAEQLCRQHGALLILDEIQTGFGRTGTMFRCQAEEVVPDILCVAKSLGGGVATIGATITREDIHRGAYGKINECLVHTSTFGGRARACAVALEAVNVTVEEGFPARARELGAWLRAQLEPLAERHPDLVAGVRGEGLMLGLEFQAPRLTGLSAAVGLAGVNRILESYFPGIIGAELLEKHGIVASFLLNNPRVLRLYPPLVATREDLARVPEALDEVLSQGLNKLVRHRLGQAIGSAGLGTMRSWIKDW